MEETLSTTATAKSDLTKVGIKEIFFKYLRFLPLFVISVALSLIVAFLYLRYTTPVYQSSGSLVIKEDKKVDGNKLDELMSGGDVVNMQTEMEVLKSRPIMERVVSGFNMNFSYFAVGKVAETNIYTAAPFRVEAFELTDSARQFAMNIKFENTNSFRVDDELKSFTFGQLFKNSNGVFRLVKKEGIIGPEYSVRYASTTALANAFISALTITPKGNTNILIITAQATNPQLAADLVNRLMREYSLYSLEEKNETVNQQIDFIEGRLAVVDDELDSITTARLNYQKANNLIDFEAQSSEYFDRIRGLSEQMAEQSAQAEIAQTVEYYLRNSQNDFNTTPSTLGITDVTLNTLIAAYNVVQLERKALLDRLIPPNNPQVKAKELEIEQLRRNALENLGNIRRSYAASINGLKAKNTQAQTGIRLLPEKQQRLLEIERQQATKQAVYNILLEQKERSSITLAATTSNIRVVGNAIANTLPVAPNRRTIQLMAVLIGLMLPAIFIIVLELLNDKITSRNDIERITDITILGEVGHSFAKEPLIVKPNNRGFVAEQFRIIRSNLQYVINNIANPVILVTSSFSGEGKSFISVNIGGVMALTGKRTIILEFDIRKPKILSHLNLPKKPGLTNYLLGKIKLEELPVPVPGMDNLFVLACGPVPPNPAELLLDPKFNELFAYLKSNFDVVVMDTAPVGMVSDALTLSPYADATLYIARQGHTYKKQVGLIDDFYRQHKLPKVSLILNDVKATAGYGGYGYGYGYGYNSGYFDDEEAQSPSFMSRWFGWVKASKKKKMA
jgi:capsular exopolysaccharide synthesis family protein